MLQKSFKATHLGAKKHKILQIIVFLKLKLWKILYQMYLLDTSLMKNID